MVAFNQADFEAINGFPNTFWGWGGEDDEMYSRIVEVSFFCRKPVHGIAFKDVYFSSGTTNRILRVGLVQSAMGLRVICVSTLATVDATTAATAA